MPILLECLITNMKIFILSPNLNTLLTKEHRKSLEANGDITYVDSVHEFQDVEGLMEDNGDKVLAIDPDFSDWKVPNGVIDKIPNLKAICLQTTSFSWVDIDHASTKGIPVMNLRGFSTKAVAEWAIMMALNVARRIPLIIKDEWNQDYKKHQGIELMGKTAGIIGLGSIGSRIGDIAKGLGMEVIYWSKSSRSNSLKKVALADLMKDSDFVFPALAQNDGTKGLITDDSLRSMKKSAIFVSIVHHVYNHQLLLEMAKDGELFGYAFEEEGDNKLTDYQGNVWGGPSLAWTTKGSMKRNADQWIESIISAAKGKYPTKVN